MTKTYFIFHPQNQFICQVLEYLQFWGGGYPFLQFIILLFFEKLLNS